MTGVNCHRYHVVAFVLVLWPLLLACKEPVPIPPTEGVKIFNPDLVRKSLFKLEHFASGPQKSVYGSAYTTLYRIIDTKDGLSIEELHSFSAPITGLHVMQDGTLIVATNPNSFDATSPGKIYAKDQRSGQVSEIKTLEHSAALWWSLASDANNLYVGEYGPKAPNLSSRVWSTDDRGLTWQVAFRRDDLDGFHIHRVAVDPFTRRLWVTHGDEHDAVWQRDERGEWIVIEDEPHTSIGFTESLIAFGEDRSKGRVLVHTRDGDELGALQRAISLDPRDHGYGGNVYDIKGLPGDKLLALMKRYPDKPWEASLWYFDGHAWSVLASFGLSGGPSTIGGPDRFGRYFVAGYTLGPFDR